MLQNHVFKSTLENQSFVTKGGPEGGLESYIYILIVISDTHSFKTLPQVCGGVHWGDTRTRMERELHLPCQNVKMLTSGEPPPKKKTQTPFISFQPLVIFFGGERFY